MTGFLPGRWEGRGSGPGHAEGGLSPRVALPSSTRARIPDGASSLSGARIRCPVAWAPPQSDPARPGVAHRPRQVRDLWLPVPTARVAQLAHEEAHGRGAIQLHVRALREALREAGQRQVPHAQKPPRPQAGLTRPTTDRPYLFVHSDTTPGLAGARTAAGGLPDRRPEGGAPAPPRGWAPPTPPYLWRWRLGLHCQNCVKRAERD